VGRVGTSYEAPPEIAPVKSAAPRPEPAGTGSVKLPGLAQPASSTAVPRR